MSYNNYTPPYVPNLGNGQGWAGGFAPAPQVPQTRGNKIYVIDANDALSRMAMPDSLMIYIQQDETAVHEVYTDTAGRKAIRTRMLTDAPTAADPTTEYVTRKEFDALRAEIAKLAGGINDAN